MSNNSAERRVDFDEAKKLSVSEFLARELGVNARKVGSGLRLATCPACGESKNRSSTKVSISPDDRSWKCHSCGEKGSILDAAMLLWGCSVVEANTRLVGNMTGFKHAPPRKSKEQQDAEDSAKTELMRDALKKLQQATTQYANERAPLAYLVNERKIPLELVREAQRQGMIGFLPSDPSKASTALVKAVGEKMLRETGLWKPDKRLPGIACRPLVFFLPNVASAEFRLIGEAKEGWNKSIRYGTLEYPYWWQGTQPQCMVVEGMIDMLSAVALGWKGHVMGLTGCNTYHKDWFTKARDRHDLKRYVVALDNDDDNPKNPGQKWATKLNDEIRALGIMSYIKTPEHGDINDILKQRAQPAA